MNDFKNSTRHSVFGGLIVLLLGLISMPAISEEVIEEQIVTGTRVKLPGLSSTSPIQSLTASDIEVLHEPEVGKIFRDLPIAIAGDGQNVNNGSDGIASIDLRGLGDQRNLIMIEGLRMMPANFKGTVDASIIPSSMLKRVDILTGGASSVYGSDAIAGAINFVLKKDFEGLELSVTKSLTDQFDGDIINLSATLGGSFDDGRGNAVMGLTWVKRSPVWLAQRPLGTLGIATASGANYSEFLQGKQPAAAATGCDGPFIVESGGSTTAIPTRVQVVGAGGTFGQFRNDRTIGTECSRFNFNPFNYYQTPQEKTSFLGAFNYQLNDDLEVYSRFTYAQTDVKQQVAPSGTFGATFNVPLSNPFLSDQARKAIIDHANNNKSSTFKWTDTNNNNIVDAADTIPMVLRRRTIEFGARSELFDSSYFQTVFGFRGTLLDKYNFEANYQHGRASRVTVRDGYTSLTNIQNALNATSKTTCVVGGSCVPLDLFGGFGTITPEMAAYAKAIALQSQLYSQDIINVNIGGTIDSIQSPMADTPVGFNVGFEYRRESGQLIPDECLKLAPSSCQGGAGGNLLPIAGAFSVKEYFMELVAPLAEDQPYIESLNLELGARYSDYTTTKGSVTWKTGITWRPIDTLLTRLSFQKATRAPNIQELYSPITTGLSNAQTDPCSKANTNITAAVTALCIDTGVPMDQVGKVDNFISGQANDFRGSDPVNLPDVEKADTFSVGAVWNPELLDGIESIDNWTLKVDYYKIDIKDYIGRFSVQEILDNCYNLSNKNSCARIKRVSGSLTISGAGVVRYTTNLKSFEASGIDFDNSISFDLNSWGSITNKTTMHLYLSQKSQSSSNVAEIDCNGFYGGSDCDPTHTFRMVNRTTWDFNDLSVSIRLRHLSGIDILASKYAGTNKVFSAFRSIPSYQYVDLDVNYKLFDDKLKLSLAIDNLFKKDPPVVGNEAGSTAFNSGNTFPSNFDTLGSVYKFNVKYTF